MPSRITSGFFRANHQEAFDKKTQNDSHSDDKDADCMRSEWKSEEPTRYTTVDEVSRRFLCLSLSSPSVDFVENIFTTYPIATAILDALPKLDWLRLRRVSSVTKAIVDNRIAHLTALTEEWFQTAKKPTKKRRSLKSSSHCDAAAVNQSCTCLNRKVCSEARKIIRSRWNRMYDFFSDASPKLKVLPKQFEKFLHRKGGFINLEFLIMDLDLENLDEFLLNSLPFRIRVLTDLQIKLTRFSLEHQIEIEKTISWSLLLNLRILDLSKVEVAITRIFRSGTHDLEGIALEEIHFPQAYYEEFENDFHFLSRANKLRKMTLPHFCWEFGKMDDSKPIGSMPSFPALEQLVVACWPDSFPVAPWKDFFNNSSNLASLDLPLCCDIASRLVEGISRVQRLNRFNLFVPEEYAHSFVTYDPVSFGNLFSAGNLAHSLTDLTIIFGYYKYNAVLRLMNENLRHLRKLDMIVQHVEIFENGEDIVHIRMPLTHLKLTYVYQYFDSAVEILLGAHPRLHKTLKNFEIRSEPLFQQGHTDVSPFELDETSLSIFIKRCAALERVNVANFRISSQAREKILGYTLPSLKKIHLS